MKPKNLFSLALALALIISNLYSQKTTIYTDIDYDFKNGVDLFNKQKYTSAQKCFQKVVNYYGDAYCDIKTDAEYYSALCAIEMFNKDTEYLITKFIAEHPESPKVKFANFQMGKFQYRKKRYKKAIIWIEKVDTYDLSNEQLAEYYFKLGYSYLIIKDYEKAGKAFYEIKNADTKYSAPAIYYYSHIAYINKNYQTALEGFQKLTENENFAPVVPYYIAQIYYLQKKYEEIIDYVPSLLDSATTKRAPEIARIIGVAYYYTSKYKEAVPYLEIYKDKAISYTREDSYQLAYAYYRTQNYEKASKAFQEVTGKNDSLSQNAYYHLADCYLKKVIPFGEDLGLPRSEAYRGGAEKNNARMAFSSASKLDFDEVIKEDAMFNYAKLTYELSYWPFNEAVNAFNKYIELYPNSERINEAYNYQVKVFMNTKNYKDALSAIEKIKTKIPDIEQAYQRIAFFRALELFNNLQFQKAIQLLDKSLTYSPLADKSIKAQSLYWKAEAFYRLKNYALAIENYKKFLLSTGAFELPEYITSYYNLGYAYFKKKEYETASSWFRKYVKNTKNRKLKTVGDAYIRIADCFFISSKYHYAIDYYDKAIEINTYDTDYALFQKGFSKGLLKEHNQKIIVLNQLVNNYSNSPYYDDALFELAITYVIIEANDMAVNNYQTIINEFPNSSYVKKALIQLGLIYYNSDQNHEALTCYKRVIAEYSGTPEAKNALIQIKNVYVDMNDVDSYFDYIMQLGDFANVTLAEQDSLTYLSAEKLYMSGDCAQSKIQFKKYIEKYSKGSFILNANFYKAECNYNANENHEALQSYNYVISKPKNDFTELSLVRAAAINFYLKNYYDALQNYTILENVAEVQSNCLIARFGQMRSNFLLKNYSNAIKNAVKVLKIKKIPDEIFREAHFTLAKSYFAQNDLESAFDEFQIIAQDCKTREGAESKYKIAEIYFLQEKYNLAENEIFDFIKQNTPHQYWLARSFILLADIYVKMKDNYQAKATLQSIIDNYNIKEDEILETANQKLNGIIEGEKAPEQAEVPVDNIKFDDNVDGKYNQLFEIIEDTIEKE